MGNPSSSTTIHEYPMRAATRATVFEYAISGEKKPFFFHKPPKYFVSDPSLRIICRSISLSGSSGRNAWYFALPVSSMFPDLKRLRIQSSTSLPPCFSRSSQRIPLILIVRRARLIPISPEKIFRYDSLVILLTQISFCVGG